MSLTIQTKYYGATNTRGARIKATPAFGQSVSIPYPYELSGVAVHAEAVKAWLKKFGYANPIHFHVGDAVGGGFIFIANSDVSVLWGE